MITPHDAKLTGVVLQHRNVACNGFSALQQSVVVQGKGVVEHIRGPRQTAMRVRNEGDSQGRHSWPPDVVAQSHAIQ